jgi:hypothetical protein
MYTSLKNTHINAHEKLTYPVAVMHNELSLQQKHTAIPAVPNTPLICYQSVSVMSHYQPVRLHLKLLSPHHDYQALGYYNKSIYQAFGFLWWM